MINHEKKFIFIHIPKCGGTSIGKMLLNDNTMYDDKEHNNYQEELVTATYDEYFKFSVVRNPWSRLVSLYHEKHPFHTNNMSFKNYIYEVIVNDKNTFLLRKDINAAIHAAPYTSYWFNGTIDKIDYIGRFEDIQVSWSEIAKRLNYDSIMLPKNRAGKYYKHYTEYYDAETREIVARAFARDIELFGYEFE